ncbi:MAG: ParB/RepB/Spo0J family partition protein [Burkholderiales bacterium]|nr:ParB/RepB/Spo0J family partition protein [Burkholderiales bacterium]PZN06172.1 MAG: chromosome partitioning protein ParB [Pseudomonadota bacterium]
MSKPKLKGLGRGLDVLLGREESAAPQAGEALANLPVDQLQPGKYQPRTRMDQASLEALAESIKAQGLMQPILVRRVAAERYEIIAGERRWRAARLAGLSEVPVIIREVPDQAALAMALIENIQRENLNPLEEAQGIQRLIDEFNLTHEKAAEAVGRSRAATTNLLRLLKLTAQVQQLVFEEKLDMGHARALLSLDGHRQVEVAQRVVEEGLSVRETEKLVQSILNPKLAPAKPAARKDRDVARLEEELSERLGTRVEVKPGKKGTGKLIISYMSYDHLDELLKQLRPVEA